MLWEYVFDPESGPYNRVRRQFDENGKVQLPKNTDAQNYTDDDARRNFDQFLLDL